MHTYKIRVLLIYEMTREPVVTAVDKKKASFQEKKKEKKIAPANYTAEGVCIDQIILKST